jgi:hypothetical protein
MFKRIAIFLLAVLLSGCGPRLVYPHLDWLIPWYVSDYISLDSDQKSMLEDRLAKQLDWHCRTQLPAYAGALREMGQDLTDSSRPVTVATLQTYNARFMALWKELIQQVAPDITAILTTSTDEQIDELFKNLEKQNQKFKEKYVDLPREELSQNRQKRMLKHIKYWISRPNPGQILVVEEWNTQLTPIGVEWLENRQTVQSEARRLLSGRHDDQSKIDGNTGITISYLAKLIRMLTEDQRSYLQDRVESLAADFEALSCDPQKVPRPTYRQ